MFWFDCILAIIAVVIFIAALVAPKTAELDGSDVRPRVILRRVGYGFITVIVLITFFLSFTQVDTKNLGVITTFGRPTGSIDNGIHFVAPWQNVTEISDRVQTDTYASDNGNEGKQQGGAVGTCVNVRIARQATACVNVSVRWQIQESGVDYLFRNYKDNDAITDNLVLRDLQVAMNETLAPYDPLGLDTNGNSTNEALSAASGPSYSADVLKQLQAAMPVDRGSAVIDIQSINLPLIQFDSNTQSHLNQILTQIAQTQVADQAKNTALAQAAANQALAASVADDPNVLVSKCLDILKDAVDKGQALPAGFSCFGPSTTSIAVGK